MSTILKFIFTSGLLLANIAAQACTLSAWDSTTGAAAGGPGDATVIARYAGQCAMNGTAGTVTNNGVSAAGGPTNEPRMVSRFYFLATGNGNATLFQAFSDNAATASIYTVSFNGANVTVTPNDGGAIAVAAVNATTNWHSVEIDWTQGGDIKLWVDSDATTVAANATGSSGNAGSVINTAILGGIGGAGGFSQLLFDAYVSHQTTAIGRELVGDATGNDIVDIADVVAIIDEITGGAVNVGTPDCTEDGNINLNDVLCTIELVLDS